VEVREIRESEVDELADLTVAAYRALLGALGPEYERDLADVGSRVATPGLVVLVAVTEGRVLGGVTYVDGAGPYAEFADAGEAGFRHLAVAPDLQRSGAGTALVQACIDRASSSGKTRLALFTTDTMTTAQRVYERLGFQRVAARDWVYAGELCLLGYVLDITV
jgi:GNAT superfamily N-acetyltransferase